ncbi:MAG: hypothetical protein ACFNPU_02105 [Corynebacterium matruchotii]|uniref:hypothetical protein n=1 Tax=Corynebacterium matruchotii TaxID=43768 RepID=UPI00361DE7B2
MATETLTIERGARGLISLLQRAVALQDRAMARFSTVSDAAVDVFVTTPFAVIASRRVAGSCSRAGAAVLVSDLLADATDTTMTAAALDAGWGMGALPPTTGFELLDEIPADVVQRLSDQGRALARQFSGPLGPPQSLMDQAVITVNDDTEIPMRLVFTLTALGLIPGMDAPAAIPRHLRVSRNSRWVRVDAPFGSAYHSSGINLLAL